MLLFYAWFCSYTRWVPKNDKLHIKEYDSNLPQFDDQQEQRRKELEKKRQVYVLANKVPGMPMQVNNNITVNIYIDLHVFW